MPMRPSHQGCAFTQAIVSAPSSASKKGLNRPEESNRPRQSCLITPYPLGMPESPAENPVLL